MSDLKDPLKYFDNLENRARYKLIKRYNKPLSYHDIKIINDILYNEKTHYVEQFKEYLIYEDYNEFLKRFYKKSELKIKLPKILNFYEKYSKIYANYTVIPESKYMYKNIKRKQKMIDQMQNNKNNESEEEEDEDSNEDMSNTVFSSRVMNSIYCKTLSSLNKSDRGGNSEQSINDFLNKINNIEKKAISTCLKNNFFKNGNKYNKSQKDMFLPLKKLNKELLTNKHTPKTSRLNTKKNETKLNSRIGGNNSQKNKMLDIQFTYSRKKLNNDIKKNNTNNNSNNNIKSKNINQNSYNNNSNLNNPNLIFINSYVHKKSNSIFNNNNYSIGNNNNSITNNSTTFHGQKNSLNLNSNLSKPKLPTALLKQSVINKSNNINKYKENISITNINNYFTNITNNLTQKHKISLGETLLKNDKIILSTNSSISPKIIKEQIITTSNSKTNIFNNKKPNITKEKEKEKSKNKEYQNPALSSNKISTKKIKSHILSDRHSIGNSITFLSNKFLQNKKLKNINKLNKKKNNKIQNKEKEKDKDNAYNDIQLNINYKKPESHRNYCHSKILSSNNSITKNNINNKINNNSNNNFKITVGLKHDHKQNSQKVISSPCSPNNSSYNFYFQSNLQNNKNKNNDNMETNIKKTLEEYTKKRFVQNYNIINNIHDNSTQINIYTGNELYKSLHFHNNSVFNSSNLTPASTFSKSPIGIERGMAKDKKNLGQGYIVSNTNNNYHKSNIKGKDNQNKYNLNLRKLINSQNLEGDKPIISERQMTHKKLFEKLGKYFFKNKNENHFINNVNNNVNNNTNINIKINNNKKYNKANNNYNNNNTKKSNNNYNNFINKIINKNTNSYKILKNKTNNNTPVKNKYNPLIIKPSKKNKNICLSPQETNNVKKMNKVSSKQNINYNNIISNLNDLKNLAFDEGNIFLIHSERNKNSKIVFK